MRSELDAKRVGQRGFEDDFLFDRIVEAVFPAKGSGGFEFERPVALFADVRALEEAEQVLGVERIEGVGWRTRLGKLIVVGRGDGWSEGQRQRDAEGT